MRATNNKIIIGNKEISFKNDIKTVLEFTNCFVVLLTDSDIVPVNNIEALDYNGNKIWNISDIIILGIPDAYVYIEKGGKDQLITQSYTGVRYVINIKDKTIVGKSYTK